ncbi:hypothetical protein HG535_0C06260 [Zygotorulaspora mrakii]|uniref:DNA-directed RNA polymerase III subunit RPC3 n=1 Tax=Zygotorulaspora mrakii TaxID=42260 RepID=A0A7H9B0W4_ZYGMR|nr:uncharacterized protein HG535_0C06260 [Zygotorulaspora mrakii]QLG72271.1 hypothetical protein HG535_0C06260 [Zygotorulaspora mrakii]
MSSAASDGANGVSGGTESVPGSMSTEDDVMITSSLEQRTLNPDWFLYTELFKYHLGERAASIIDVLICKGRLSIFEIRDRIPNLDTRSVKITMVSLVQLRCVRYWEEVSHSGKSTTYYYINEDGLLLFLYSGLINDEFSKQFPHSSMEVSQIIQNILSLGSITVKDFLQNIESKESQIDMMSIFVRLVESEFLVPLTKLHCTPINDLWNTLYQKEYNAIPRTSTLSDLKKRSEAKSKAKIQFQSFLENSKSTSQVIYIDPITSLKAIKNNLPLTINLERFFKIRRTKHLVQFAKSRIGSTPSEIYRVALSMTESKSPPLTDPLTKTGLLQELEEATSIKEDIELSEEKTQGLSFSAIDIAKHLPSSLDLRGTLTSKLKTNKRSNDSKESKLNKKLKTKDGFAIPALPKINESKNDVDKADFSDDFEDFDDDDQEPHSLSLINCHLKLLASSAVPFLKETRPGVYFIPYSKIVPLLKSSVYDYVLSSTMGPSAMRIRRCICENSLVSEKVINSTALMKEKDIRSTIASLIKYNVLEIQEVPRTADRAASRAVFLFRSNERHAYSFMMQNLAWNIADLHYKKEKMKEERSTLLTKANRDDVKGREAELLLPSELNQLKSLNERELNILVRVLRLLSLWEVYRLF